MERYIATERDIAELTTSYMQARERVRSVGETYLRYLAATALHIAQQGSTEMEALESVSQRFYAVVLENLPPHLTAQERNSESNWARSTKSTLVRWLRVEGRSLTQLDIETVTKHSLEEQVPVREPRPLSLLTFERRVTRLANDVEAMAPKIDEKHRKGAVHALEELLDRVVGLLADLGVKETQSPQIALKTGQLYRSKAGALFYPVTPAANGSHVNG